MNLLYCKHCNGLQKYWEVENGPHMQALCYTCNNHLKFIKQNRAARYCCTFIMGLNNTAGKVTYLNMKQGKFARKNANGDIDLFDSVEGVITSAEFKDDEYNGTSFRKISLVLQDGEERYILQVRCDSGYYRGLTNSIANADITKPVNLIASSKEVNGKPQTTIFVNQSGQALKWKWTKDNPGNLPALDSVKLKGKTVYDNSAQQAFYEQFWNTLFSNAAIKAKLKEARIDLDNEFQGETSDDLPF